MINDRDNKPVTLDDLATMVKKGFDEMDEKFRGIDEKFWNIDKKFDNLGVKIDAMPSQRHVDSRFDALEKSMTEKMTEPSITRDRALDKKTNVVAEKLGVKTIFTQEEVVEVERLTPFAVRPAMD